MWMIGQKDTNLLITLVDITLHSAWDMSRRNEALVCIVVCRQTRQTWAGVLRRDLPPRRLNVLCVGAGLWIYSQNSTVITITALYFCTFVHDAYSISTFTGDCRRLLVNMQFNLPTLLGTLQRSIVCLQVTNIEATYLCTCVKCFFSAISQLANSFTCHTHLTYLQNTV